MRLIFDCSYPRISSNIFKYYDWFEFYSDAKESISPNIPASRRHEVSIHIFVDAYLAWDKSARRSNTGLLIFINKAPIHWYNKRQTTVEASNFREEFCAIQAGFEIFEALRYKLQMFKVPIYGSTNVFCDNEAGYNNTITPESVLKKKHHYIA